MLFMLEVTDESLAHAMATLPELGEALPAVFCDEAVHDWLRAHPGDLLRLRPWPEIGCSVGECPGCGTTIAVEVSQ